MNNSTKILKTNYLNIPLFVTFMAGIFIQPVMPQGDHVSDNEYYYLLRKDTIPLATILKKTATIEKILYHDTNGYFRKSTITKVFIAYNQCHDIQQRNNVRLHYLQHPNFDENAIASDSIMQPEESFNLPLMRFED